jgi:hypothetical protein
LRRFGPPVVDAVVEAANGSISAAVRLATTANALTAPLVDPDAPYRNSLRASSPLFTMSRWSDPATFVANAALSEIARRRLIIDEGHSDASAIESVRRAAEASLRARAYDQAWLSELTIEKGFVKEASDERILSLQVADVAAGLARTILAAEGYRGLVGEFRCVIYNDRVLTRDSAKELDSAIIDHRNLHLRAVG